MIQAQLARDLAVQRARQLSLPAELESSTDAKGRIRLVKMYLKAAAELDKGNLPRYTNAGYLIESRSSLVGQVGRLELIEPTGEIKNLARMGQVFLPDSPEAGPDVEAPLARIKLYFTVTGGEVFLYDPLLHRCTCDAMESGCWHGASVEVWEMAQSLLPTEEERMTNPPEPEDSGVEFGEGDLVETSFFIGAEPYDPATQQA